MAFRRHAQARRLVLRLNSCGTGVIVTVPNGISRRRALEFAERSQTWIAQQIEKHGGLIRLEPGQVIPLRGVAHEIRHAETRRGVVSVDDACGHIHVPGDPAHATRRLLEFLKAKAREDLTLASRRYAALMDVSFRRIIIRDQKSRWGSCSSAGELSYSWRLILTPGYVLDYVAAHEVAHLRHLDHSPRFWRLVLTHCPDVGKARTWLRKHGHEVHRVIA